MQGIGTASPCGNPSRKSQGTDSENPPLEKKVPVYHTVDDTSDLYEFLPKRKLRRVDHYARLALLAAGKALKDTPCGLISKKNTGVIIASGFGALKTTFDFLDSYIEKGDRLSSPIHFSNSVHNAAGAHISICYDITGPNLTVSQFDLSFISALITAQAWLEKGSAGAVLIGTTEAYCDVLGYCMDRLAHLKGIQDCSFSESAVFFFVTRDEHPAKYGYFSDVSIGRIGPDGPDVSLDGATFLSPSAASPCGGAARYFLKNNDTAVLKNEMDSPTDCGRKIILASGSDKKITYVKIGQNDTFGKLVFSRT